MAALETTVMTPMVMTIVLMMMRKRRNMLVIVTVDDGHSGGEDEDDDNGKMLLHFVLCYAYRKMLQSKLDLQNAKNITLARSRDLTVS